MNQHTPAAAIAQVPGHELSAERAVIVGILVDPTRIADLNGKLTPADFEGEIHKRLMAILLGLHAEGRRPSVEAVSAIMGDDELAPGVTARVYLRSIVTEALVALHLPFEDAVETVRDAAQRRELHAAAEAITLGALGSASVVDLCTDTIGRLDEIAASARAQRRRAYDAKGAAQMALDWAAGEGPAGPTTGLADLDRIIGGWPRGQLSILAGRPGAGKSAVATSCVLRAARAGYPVCFFSIEMLGEQLGARLLTDMAYTHSAPIHYDTLLRREHLDDNAKARLARAQNELSGLPIHIEEQRGLSISEIATRARKVAATFDRKGQKLAAIFVDHIGLVRASGRYAGNRVRELAEVTDGLATIAKELDVAVVGLCQLNRGVEGRENKRPSTADLRESGAIEEDASVIVFLYRASYYLAKQRFDSPEAEQKRIEQLEASINKIELGVDKNRNGHVGIVDAFIDIGANALRNGNFNRPAGR